MDFKVIVYKKFTDTVLDVTLQKAFRKNKTLVEFQFYIKEEYLQLSEGY